MLDLSALIQAQITEAPKIVAGGVPKRRECLQVTRVFPGSIAENCGLAVGHLILSFDEQPAIEKKHERLACQELISYDPVKKQRRRIRWSGCELGIQTQPTVEACLAAPDCDPEHLLALWELGQFKELHKLTTQGLQAQAKTGFLDRLRKKVVPQDSPLTALHGASLIETSKSQEGLHWLETYQARYADHHPPRFAALVPHYLAVESLAQGQTEQAKVHLEQSFRKGRLERTQTLWSEWSNQPLSSEGRQVGQMFPVELSLVTPKGDSVTLAARLKQALESTFLLLCTLGERDWKSHLETLIAWCRVNRQVLRETMEEVVLVSPNFDTQDLSQMMKELRSTGVTVCQLQDREGVLQRELGQAQGSDFFALSEQGRILGQSLKANQLWHILERLTSESSLPEPSTASTDLSFVRGERGYQDAPAAASATSVGVPLWLAPPDALPYSSCVCYLIPSEKALSLSPRRLEDAYPQGWACRTKDEGLAEWPELVQFDRSQLETYFGAHAYKAWVHAHILPPMQQRALEAQHFVLIRGEWKDVTRFGHLQTSLAACRTAVRAGGLGVIDRFANRWLSAQVLDNMERDLFDIKDHIAVQVAHAMCVTQGLDEKFACPDYCMRVRSPHLTGAAVHLLNEIAAKSAMGKRYAHKSLFRWRSGAHLCQVMFKQATQEVTGPEKRNIFEAVDMAIDHGVVQPSNNAEATLHHFTLGAPHWDLSYGWPAQELPFNPKSSGLHIWGLQAGESKLSDAVDILGPAHKMPQANRHRWLFSSPSWGPLLRLEVEVDEAKRVHSLQANTLCWNEHTLNEQSTLTDFVGHLGEPDLTRRFVAPPDQSPVRTEALWILPHPQKQSGTLLLSAHFDQEQSLWQSSLTYLQEAPEMVKQELSPVYGQDLLTSYVNKIPAPVGPMSAEAKQLRVYLESSAQLLRQLILQFGKTHWVTEDLDGYSMTAGSYLLTGGVPSRTSLEGIGLPAQLFLNAYHSLDDYVNHPANQVKFRPQAEKSTIDYTMYATFLWLIGNITQGEADESELRLAIDLSQVFAQYKLTLGQLTN